MSSGSKLAISVPARLLMPKAIEQLALSMPARYQVRVDPAISYVGTWWIDVVDTKTGNMVYLSWSLKGMYFYQDNVLFSNQGKIVEDLDSSILVILALFSLGNPSE